MESDFSAEVLKLHFRRTTLFASRKCKVLAIPSPGRPPQFADVLGRRLPKLAHALGWLQDNEQFGLVWKLQRGQQFCHPIAFASSSTHQIGLHIHKKQQLLIPDFFHHIEHRPDLDFLVVLLSNLRECAGQVLSTHPHLLPQPRCSDAARTDEQMIDRRSISLRPLQGRDGRGLHSVLPGPVPSGSRRRGTLRGFGQTTISCRAGSMRLH
mmetsp:Transcript_123548/g.283314  ORF Transcript_123548/g.283314 Transcript_123548/m.283314 type:complete len:210 (-) Transcript_123548:111-740(-)